MNKVTSFLEKYLSPVGARLGNQRHLKALADGMMMTLPLLIVGSIFMILANPPINMETVDMNTTNVLIRFLISWKEWATTYNAQILAPYNMTFGLLGLMTAFSVSYCLAKSYKMNAAINGIMSMSVFLLVCASVVPVETAAGSINAITANYLDSNGLFVALILSFVTVEITRLIEARGIKVKFPDSVPPMVTTFVNSLLPLLVNIIIIYSLNLLLISVSGKTLPEMIMNILTPAINVGNNVWVYALIFLFSNVLWFLGINGTTVIFPIVFMIGLNGTAQNAEAIAAGGEAVTSMNLQLFRYAMLGGTGGTLGLIILMWRSKSAKLRTIAKISVAPGICSINEPITFGVPIVYNPILALPYILTPSISVLLGYYVQEIGWVSRGYVADPSFIPFFVQGWMSAADFRNLIFMFFLILLSVFLYLPFYRVFEKMELKKEEEEAKAAAKENENG